VSVPIPARIFDNGKIVLPSTTKVNLFQGLTSIGLLLLGQGQVWKGGLMIEKVANDVPSTASSALKPLLPQEDANLNFEI